jgi:glycosyltransferase involved in cell wall biosynthesis
MKKITVIAPVYNENLCLPEFIQRTTSVAESMKHYEIDLHILFVDDGSTDGSSHILENASHLNSRIQVIHLASNFGHQSAVWCGLEAVEPDETVIVMDCDLQDPPEVLLDLVKASESFEIVFTQRKTRIDKPFKKFSAFIYYRLLGILSDGNVLHNSGDFYLLKPTARRSLLLHKENVKYIRGLIANLGFNVTTLLYDRDARFAGKTHYTFPKMLRLAIAGVTGFSIKPLIFVTYIAIVSGLITLFGAVSIFLLKIFRPTQFSPGIAAIILILLTLGSLILICLAVISLYIARITIEVKNRPLYIISKKEGYTHDQSI